MVKAEKKICKQCKVLKCTSEFSIEKRETKSGLKIYIRPRCKVCKVKRVTEWKKANRAKSRAHQREVIRRKKLGVKRKSRKTYKEIKEYKRMYSRERRRSDPTHRLLKNLRSRLWHALHGNSKSAATRELLGICVDECRKYIEAQFTEGMSWDTIAVDHIVPCASFDMSDPQEQRRCFHYTNLQPLFPPDNSSKGAKITPQAAKREWDGARWVDKE